jgi:hypothetical protein
MPTFSPVAEAGMLSFATALPQDPYWPQETPAGPSFLDTEACLCALQAPPGSTNTADAAVWHCIGNQTQGVYDVSTGKFFNTLHGGDSSGVTNLSISDASNGPDTSKTLVWNADTKQFSETADFSSLTAYDQNCTAQNQSSFSTSFYRTADELAKNEEPVDGAPCWRAGAVPVQLQTVESWQSQGCLEGFLCT